MRAVGLSIMLFAVGASACSDNFPPQYWIQTPRLIAITAEPPEVPRNATATLTAVVADGDGTANPTFQWYLCTKVEPANFDGDIDPDCLTDTTTAAYLKPLGNTASIVVTMPDVDASTLGIPDYTLGLYEPYRVDTTINGKTQKSIYRLRYLLPTPIPANTNPQIEGLFIVPPNVDAGAQDVMPLPTSEPLATMTLDGEIKLRGRFADGASEPFLVIDDSGAINGGTITADNIKVKPATEDLHISWLVQYGDLSSPTSGDQTDTVLKFKDKTRQPPNGIPPEGVVVHLWAVGRDERGGTSVTTGAIRIVQGTADMN